MNGGQEIGKLPPMHESRPTSKASSEVSRQLESSLSSTSDVSLPQSLQLGPSPGQSPDSVNRSLGAIPKRRLSPDS